MAKETRIGWCDSTVNPVIGCDGCELWRPETGIKDCYAGRMTERYAGRKGWPDDFSRPGFYLRRVDEAVAWQDLTAKRRPNKPWLDLYPRVIFLNDLSDTFSKSVPEDFIEGIAAKAANSRHVWLWLTKRVTRMALFFRQPGRMRDNFWIGTTVTTPDTLNRIAALTSIAAHVRFVSFEPLLRKITYEDLASVNAKAIHWIITGGMSGPGTTPTPDSWFIPLRDWAIEHDIGFFHKQAGGDKMRVGVWGGDVLAGKIHHGMPI